MQIIITAVLCLVIRQINCAVFQTFSYDPNINTNTNIDQQNTEYNNNQISKSQSQSQSQSQNIWNQAYWYQTVQPSYTLPTDNYRRYQNNYGIDSPIIDQSATPINSAEEIRIKFEKFKTQNWKNYDPVTEAYRFNIFSQKLKQINSHNSDQQETYEQGINQFSDLTHQQFVAIYLSAKVNDQPLVFASQPVPQSISSNINATPVSASTPVSAPISVSAPILTTTTGIDWRLSNVLTAIKDQGKCGACWAYSTVSTIQSHVAIKRMKAPQLYSEQQLIDCCNIYDDNCRGCSGGWPGSAYQYIGKLGIAKSIVYPNINVVDTCKQNIIAKQLYIQKQMSYKRSYGIQNARAYLTKGPVTAVIDGTYWDSYQSGVMTCNSTPDYNHAVIIVGVQTNGVFILRNSWGTTWGEKGYIRINGNVGTSCGLFDHLLVPMLL